MSRDGRWLYLATGTRRVEIETGQILDDGWFKSGILVGKIKSAISRTENQAHHDRSFTFLDQRLLNAQGRAIYRVSDAIGPGRILVLATIQVPDAQTVFLVLTEVNCDTRDGNQNRNWMIEFTRKRDVAPIGARFVDKMSVEMWTSELRDGETYFVRYLGKREGTDLRLYAERKIKVSTPNAAIPSVATRSTFNSIDVSDGSYVTSEGHLYRLKTFGGKELARIDFQGKLLRGDSSDDEDAKAIWNLCVPETAVPTGKRSWTPVARSANRSVWLLKSVNGGQTALLRLHG